MMQEADYNQVIREIHDWHDQRRQSNQPYQSTNRAATRGIYHRARSQVILDGTFPTITQAIGSIVRDNELVFASAPVESYHNSPYARIYENLMHLTQIAMIENLQQAELIRELPEELRDKIPEALAQVEELPKPQPPTLHPDTINHMATLPEDRLLWQRARDALPAWYTLLKRPYVSRYFHNSRSLGYNRWAIALCDAGLVYLDTLASCTPWQMRRDPTAYHRQVAAGTYYFIKNVGLENHGRPGQMYSDEFVNDDQASEWETALETGQLPERMTSQHLNPTKIEEV